MNKLTFLGPMFFESHKENESLPDKGIVLCFLSPNKNITLSFSDSEDDTPEIVLKKLEEGVAALKEMIKNDQELQ